MSRENPEQWVCGEFCPVFNAFQSSPELAVKIKETIDKSTRRLPWLEQVHLKPCPTVVGEVAVAEGTSAYNEEIWGCMQKRLTEKCITTLDVVANEAYL